MSAPNEDEVPAPKPAADAPVRDPRGRYKVLDELGRGGVGAVFLGRDENLGRDVAVKVLHDEAAANPEVVARFIEEAQIGGQLQHPGIVPVYELGRGEDDRPFFAMKLVKGETLAALLARRADVAEDRRRFLGIFEQICQTLGYAHARRVVHRDLKPENVMIGAFGEVQIVDWGFAKVLPEGAAAARPATSDEPSERSVIRTLRSAPGSGSHSVAGTMLGTLRYMPPEQAHGDVGLLDARSDVFALGGILCTILTGEPPYRGEGQELVRRVALAELDDAHERLRGSRADPALIGLATACLSRRLEDRPADGAAVAERVSAYLTSVEERARQAQLRAVEARFRQRNTLIAAAATVLVLLVGGGAWIWMRGEAQARREAALQRVAAATREVDEARGRARQAGLDLAAWDTALDRARQLVTLAETEGVQTAASAALLAEVDGQRSEVTREIARRDRDATMRERLVTLRIPVEDDVRVQTWGEREARRLDAEYAAAFAAYLDGTSAFDAELEPLLAKLRYGDLEVELATSLDHWALARTSLAELGEAPDAVGTARLFELARLLDPGDEWRTRLRQLLPRVRDAGDELEALAVEADLLRLGPAGCRVLSSALLQADRRDHAVAVLRRAQELHPGSFGVSFMLGVALEQMHPPQWLAAAEAQRVARAIDPSRIEALHRQGIALDQAGRPADAERLYRDLVRLEPDNPHWRFHVGRALMLQRRLDEAAEVLEENLARRPDDPGTMNNLARILGLRGENDRAREIAQRVVEVEPRSVMAHCNLATYAMKQGRPAEALPFAERAFELAPGDGIVLSVLGRVKAALGDDDAMELLERALEVIPTEPDRLDVLNAIAMLQNRRGDRAAAVANYRRVLEIDPDYAPAHVNLGAALLMPDTADEALEHLDRAEVLFEAMGTSFGETWAQHARLRAQSFRALVGRAEGTVADDRRAFELARWRAWLDAAEQGFAPDVIVRTAEHLLATSPDVFVDDPQDTFRPACAAALMYGLQGSGMSAYEARRTLDQCYEWTRRPLERWIARAAADDAAAAAEARRWLEQAKENRALIIFRGKRIDRLPEHVRAPWRELWQRVDDALAER